jgi:hypothetical protein
MPRLPGATVRDAGAVRSDVCGYVGGKDAGRSGRRAVRDAGAVRGDVVGRADYSVAVDG